MASNDVLKTLSSIGKDLDRIQKSSAKIESGIDDLTKGLRKMMDVPKSEDKIEKILGKQLKLDEKLSKMIEEQNEINSSIFQQLSDMQKFSATEAAQQHKRFKIDLFVSISAAVAGAVAAVASAISVYLMIG